jgi:hypothetical protein
MKRQLVQWGKQRKLYLKKIFAGDPGVHPGLKMLPGLQSPARIQHAKLEKLDSRCFLSFSKKSNKEYFGI